jgi:hypothetical protein
MAKKIRSADEMLNLVRADVNRLNALQTDPLPELEKLRDEAIEKVEGYVGDKWIYRTAIAVLGLVAIIATSGSIILVLQEKTTPEILVALGSAAVGGLVGLFAPPPQGQ